MVSPEHGVVAVLDWELAHKGDPIRDLGWICTNSWRFGVPELPVGGFGTREDLLAGYKESTGRTVSSEHLKFWGSFWIVLVGVFLSGNGGHLSSRIECLN